MFICFKENLYEIETVNGYITHYVTSKTKHIPNFKFFINMTGNRYIIYYSNYNTTYIYDIDSNKVISLFKGDLSYIHENYGNYTIDTQIEHSCSNEKYHIEIRDDLIYAYSIIGIDSIHILNSIYTIKGNLVWKLRDFSILDMGKDWKLIHRKNDFLGIPMQNIMILEDYYVIVNYNRGEISIYDSDKNKIWEFPIKPQSAYFIKVYDDVIQVYDSDTIYMYNIWGELLSEHSNIKGIKTSVQGNHVYTFMYREVLMVNQYGETKIFKRKG